jgi:hypothetical protein
VRLRVPGSARHEGAKVRDLFALGDIDGLIARLKD